MKLIDADALERDGWKMSRTVRVDKDTMEIQTRKPTDFPIVIEFDGEVNKVVLKGAIRNFVDSITLWTRSVKAINKEESK